MNIKKVEKRDGSIVDFDRNKIVKAIDKASRAVGSGDEGSSTDLTDRVIENLEEMFGEGSVPHVEDIQDIVEKVLIEEGRSKTAKAYILYRQERRQRRREKLKILNKDKIDGVDKKFSLNSLRVLASRYLLKNEEGEIVESPRELFERVATTVTIPDILRDDRVFEKDGTGTEGKGVGKYLDSFEDYHLRYDFAGHELNEWNFRSMAELYGELDEKGQMTVSFERLLEMYDEGKFDRYEENWQEYFQLMVEKKFLPNSPTLMNAGTRLGQLSACFVLPMGDDLGEIMDAAKDAALIFQSGGGVGINYSELRPGGDPVASTSGVASGPISFMKIIDSVTDVIKQGGKRRGANMGILSVDHPDIREFIQLKEEEGKFENFNISVGTRSEFWEKLSSGEKEFGLINPRTGEVEDEEDPEQLLELMSHSAWESADPGMIFLDRVNRYNVLEDAKGKITGTNPCGEQPLYEYESCNLGSVNLHKFVEEGSFDWPSFRRITKVATRFLDNVIDINSFPIDKIEKNTKETRKVGLGVMGLADLLYDLEIPYDSEKGYDLMGRISEELTHCSMEESVQLAKERGSFPLYSQTSYPEGELPVAGYYESDDPEKDWEGLVEEIKKNGIRNGMHTTIAPTGSISMIAGTSNGVEPEFSLAYEKSVKAGDFYYLNEVLEKKLKKRKIYSEDLIEKISKNYGILEGLDEIPEDLKEIFSTAMTIHYSDHLMAQSAWQKWITASISKTINMPNDSTVEDVLRSYLLAHQLGLKGVTIYRDGSKSEQVLDMKGDKSSASRPSPSDYIKKYLSDWVENEYVKKEFEKVFDSEFFDDGPEKRSSRVKKSGSGPEEVDDYEREVCPKCGGKLIREGGCNKCQSCGWSVCSIS